jgi:hypothetical protein
MLPRIAWLVAGALAAVLTAVRLQLWVIERDAATGWLAVVAGLALGGALWAVVLVVGLRFRSLRWVGLALVLAPLGFLSLGYYGTTRYPAQNFKTQETAAEWKTLHPTLRLALWLLALEDRQLVLTDIARTENDYEEMGLVRRRDSPHYIKEDGYAHAVDLRVSNVGEVRNWARQGLFLLMGLKTSRHVGTADHLHVSLPG